MPADVAADLDAIEAAAAARTAAAAAAGAAAAARLEAEWKQLQQEKAQQAQQAQQQQESAVAAGQQVQGKLAALPQEHPEVKKEEVQDQPLSAPAHAPVAAAATEEGAAAAPPEAGAEEDKGGLQVQVQGLLSDMADAAQQQDAPAAGDALAAAAQQPVKVNVSQQDGA